MPSLCWQVFSVSKSEWVRVVFAAQISTRKYAPLTFSPLPVTVVTVVSIFM